MQTDIKVPSAMSDTGRAPSGLIEQALALAVDLEDLLARAGQDGPCFRLRLARAHALGAVDSLAELIGS